MLTIEISAQNLFTEDFIYAPVDSLENSGEWFRSGIDLEYNIKVVSPGLEYKDYAGSGRAELFYFHSGNGDVLYHHFSEPVTSGAAYLSFHAFGWIVCRLLSQKDIALPSIPIPVAPI